ncbi:glycosyltransferase [Halapricum sp. CBA1109]|uniref:glycosyltransferase n=1 Tax=Halapricum sp. CBA1109 TaxID=2668068 RepID=UPI0012FA43C9|nr:glycosyltransferase [Halapricum sp. CBA1109]MUV88842.1 glycosyltransferase [Halapricum sp. CBA1109]
MSNDGVSDADDVAIARTHTTESQGLSRTDRPAIVLVATRDNEAALARAILYARHRGHDVLVGHADIPDADSVTFARQLDVPTFGPTRGDPDPSALVREIASTARERGYPAAITRPPSCPRIDFDATLDRLDEGGYAVEGVVAERSTETSVLVGIPAHNEAATIDDVVDGATEYADEVLVVDDGSTDGTATRARAAGATVREHETNRGYGAALRTLFTAASDRSVDHLSSSTATANTNPKRYPASSKPSARATRRSSSVAGSKRGPAPMSRCTAGSVSG